MTLENKVEQFAIDADKYHLAVQGDVNTSVVVEGGTVKSLLKAQRDNEVAHGNANANANRAEAAQSAALIQAGVYTTEALGRAAVADGQAFKVQGADDIAAFEYRRVSAAVVSTLIGIYPSYDSGFKNAGPFAKSISVAGGGTLDLYTRILRAVVDVRVTMTPPAPAESYYVERVRRNVGGLWLITIKRASDNVTVLQLNTSTNPEPSDPTVPTRYTLAGMVAGASGEILVRWADLVEGVTNTGLLLTLSRRCSDPSAPTPLNTVPAISARLGNVVMPIVPTEFATRNEAARTFTWPWMLIVQGMANTNGRYRLLAGSVTFTAAFQVAWLDLDEVASYGASDIPASAVKVGLYKNPSEGANFYYASPRQFPLAWSPGVGRVDVNPLIRLPDPAPAGGYTDAMVVRMDTAAAGGAEISIYTKANGKAGTATYLRQVFKHIVRALGTGPIPGPCDIWTAYGQYEVQRTGNESFSAGVMRQNPGSELFLAMREQGKPDFMGGFAHGNEKIIQAPTVLVDGQEISLSTDAWFHCGRIDIFQQSKMYRQGSDLSVELVRRNLFYSQTADGVVNIDQPLEHLASFVVADFYATMMAPLRYQTFTQTTEDTASPQVTGKYINDNPGIIGGLPQNVGAYTSPNPVANYQKTTPPVSKVVAWGTAGYECKMEQTYASHAFLGELFLCQQASYNYNKFYIGFIESTGTHTVTVGERWRVKTRWSFSSKN